MRLRLQVTKPKAAKAKTPKKAPAVKKSKVAKKPVAPKTEGAHLLNQLQRHASMQCIHYASDVEEDPFWTWFSVNMRVHALDSARVLIMLHSWHDWHCLPAWQLCKLSYRA